MKSEKTTKPTETATVTAHLQKLKHARKDVVLALRETILATSPNIGEEIKWNAVTFYYTGPLAPFNPKEFKRVLVVFNYFKKDCIRLVFWHGDIAKDKTGFLEGDYADGRRLAVLNNLEEVKSKTKVLQKVLKAQLKRIREAT